MIDVRAFDALGAAGHGGPNAHHHFSFANHYDPARMSWAKLRVWNDYPPLKDHRSRMEADEGVRKTLKHQNMEPIG